MIEGVRDDDDRIDRLLSELAAYGVVDARTGTDIPSTESGGSRETGRGPGAGTDIQENGSSTVSMSSAGGTATGIKATLADLNADFDFDDAVVKENLEAIILVLISVRGGAHGKRLISDLAELFGAQLSPGTVYPRLHELESAGVLSVHELVRTKEYTVADEERARELIERAMYQHLALGTVFRSSLEHI